MNERDFLVRTFHTLYSDREEGVVLCDKHGHIIYENQSFLDFFGEYDTIFASFPWFPNLDEIASFQRDKKVVGDVRQLQVDGEALFVVLLKIIPEWEASFSPLFMKALFLAINSVEDGISVVDASGRFVFYNKALENLEGYQAQDVVGRHVTDIYNVTPDTSQLLRALQGKKVIREHYQQYSMKNDRDFDVVIEAIPIYENGNVIGAVDIYRNKTMLDGIIKKYYFLQEKKENTIHYVNAKGIEAGDCPQLIGSNVKFLESLNMMLTAAKGNSPVMIYGETGTGKELFARQIHDHSGRSQQPFIAINCAAIPESLLESLLFGSVKGAFTGATNMVGIFEQADGGTIFLDELNSMALALQAKILRAIEEKKVRRLGDNKDISIDIRVISSTNYDPIAAVNEGYMRSDLYYRLAVFLIQILPLRERTDDIEELTMYFVSTFNKEYKKDITSVDSDVIQAFQKYAWPGNIRQLRNIVECAMNFVDDKDTVLQRIHIPTYSNIFEDNDQYQQNSYINPKRYAMGNPDASDASANPLNRDIISEIKEEEKGRIIRCLKETNGNISQAARLMGISRQSLQYKMKKNKLT